MQFPSKLDSSEAINNIKEEGVGKGFYLAVNGLGPYNEIESRNQGEIPHSS